MKSIFSFTAFVALLLVALPGAFAAQPRKDPAKAAGSVKPAAAQKPKDPPQEIPATAVASEDGSYRYTDAKGKKWIYRRTPFGVAHYEDKPAEPKPEETFENVKATEDGDSIRFERPGPFGVYKWQRKKTELNDMEQTVWNREKARSTSKQE